MKESDTSDPKFINNIEILIGEDSLRIYDPFIIFGINEHRITVKLEDLKNWINEIWNSQGDRNPKAYEAKKHLDMWFAEMLRPWRILSEAPK